MKNDIMTPNKFICAFQTRRLRGPLSLKSHKKKKKLETSQKRYVSFNFSLPLSISLDKGTCRTFTSSTAEPAGPHPRSSSPRVPSLARFFAQVGRRTQQQRHRGGRSVYELRALYCTRGVPSSTAQCRVNKFGIVTVPPACILFIRVYTCVFKLV